MATRTVVASRLHRSSALPGLTPIRAGTFSKRFKVAAGLLLAIGLLALIAPHIMPYDPMAMSPADRNLPPGLTHLFGTDMFGRDLFSRVLYGARPTLQVAMSAVLIGAVPGLLLGLYAGSRRTLFEQLLTQCVDAWIALPGVLVALVMAAAFGRSLAILAVALGLSSIPTFYRVVRAEAMRVSAEPFVEAARSLGAAHWQLLAAHILPNVIPSFIALVTVSIGRMLLATSALSFIGLGAPPPSPEWGSLLAEGRSAMEQSWWLIWFPGAAIAMTTFAIFLLGNALRDRYAFIRV